MAFVARSFNAWAAANPVSAACFFGGGKNVGVDACVQLATAGGDVRQMDLRRSACFLAFGTLWIGGAQYYIFNKLIPRLVPAINAPNPTFATALKAGAWDWAVHMPLFCADRRRAKRRPFLARSTRVDLPVFYCVREVATKPELGADAIPSGITCWRENILVDSVKRGGRVQKTFVLEPRRRSTMIFGPVQTLNFWLMPTHLRVPTVVTAAIVWTSLLSMSRGDRSKQGEG